ncbi:hypothetical protein GH714_036298 [Hevea brasiliensis]|uniref:Exostosin GT47 domain-containing protein n=1 Tax=Hevea brasiliensis TaxID=3981 RepID=A0A6A6L7P9_HEVBR|nr:hypothetical protein GH714_036298 [Hevea brasiliensis]
MEFPYWNRTLGADHFYVSCAGLGYESDRNLVELKKNSVQISCFPAPDGEALRFGCLPVVITDRPIKDLPLMDVLRWQEIAVFVGSTVNTNSRLKGVKRVLDRTCKDDTCAGMRRLGVAASHHLLWNEKPEPYDPLHMVVYELWLRRHTIRYARREWI